jgi:multicomponent Na+:H+ antiporter subunit E
MRTLTLNIFLALIWIFLTGEFTSANLAVGAVLGYVLLLVFRRAFNPQTSYFGKVWQVAYFFTYFFWQLLLANLRVAWEVITPKIYATPGIVAIPLDLNSDIEITILANLITLTPGTLTLDISSDKRTLYVHSMYVDDAESFRQSIKQGFETRVRELFK